MRNSVLLISTIVVLLVLVTVAVSILRWMHVSNQWMMFFYNAESAAPDIQKLNL